MVQGRLESEKGQSPPPLVCGARPDSHRKDSASTCILASRPKCTKDFPGDVTGSRDETGASSSCAYLMPENFSDEPQRISKATVLGIAKEIAENIVDKVNAEQPVSDSPTKPRRKWKNEALYFKLLKAK